MVPQVPWDQLPHALAESASVCDVAPKHAGWRGVEDKAGGGGPCCHGDILSRDTESAPVARALRLTRAAGRGLPGA